MDFKLITRVIRTLLIFATCSLPAIAAPPDPCSLLTREKISVVLGADVEQPKLVAPRLCQWSAPKQPKSTSVKTIALVLTDERAFHFAKEPISSSVKAIPTSGIGDDAVYAVSSDGTPSGVTAALYVKKGNSYFVVHAYGFPTQPRVMEVEKLLALQACSKL